MVRNKATTTALQGEVDKLLGYDDLAKAALGGPKKYAERCADRCDEFNGLLKELIRENYLRLIRKSTDYPVEYLGEDKSKSGSSWRVRTMIKVNRNGRVQPVEVHYVMHKVGGQWQVKNIIH